jgi:hypothetical protein
MRREETTKNSAGRENEYFIATFVLEKANLKIVSNSDL